VTLLIRNARVLTLNHGAIPRRGSETGELTVIDRGFVRVEGENVVEAGEETTLSPTAQGLKSLGCEGEPLSSTLSPEDRGERVIDADGRVLMPAFIDAHTHALWAGDRLDEWDLKRQGASYLDILKAGGGIMATVRAVREASEAQLADNLRHRLAIMAREGTTTVEVKSGYGLTTDDELKMLRAISLASVAQFSEPVARASRPCTGETPVPLTPAPWAPVQVVPTALLGHAIDRDQPDFIERTIDETLPAVHESFPDVPIDAYCEKSAWSLDDCRRLFERAMELGHRCRVHADQFNALGMTRWAIEHDFASVDHLEATPTDDLRALAESSTFGVMLSCSGFHIDDRYANGRLFLDAGGALAIATNCNPGSAPCSAMPFAIALAVRKLGLSAAEAVTAATVNAAALLGLFDRGRIAPGLRADLILLRHHDERMLAYEFAGDPVDCAILGERVIEKR